MAKSYTTICHSAIRVDVYAIAVDGRMSSMLVTPTGATLPPHELREVAAGY